MKKLEAYPADNILQENAGEGNSLGLSSEVPSVKKSLSLIANLKFSKDFKVTFEQFKEVFSAMSIGDFTKRINLTNRKDLFSFFGSGLNLVMEELEVNVVKKHYLENTMDMIPNMVFIIDYKGKILFVNAQVIEELDTKKAVLIGLDLSEVIQGLSLQGLDEKFAAEKQFVINYNNINTKVVLIVKKQYDKLGKHDGYIVMAKQVLNSSFKIQNLNNRYIVK